MTSAPVRNILLLGAQLPLLLISISGQSLHAGAFTFAGEQNGVDLVTHPIGYNGSGGTVTANICFVDNAASMPFAASAAVSVDNIVNTWNAMDAVSPNLASGTSNNIPTGEIDFESVLLHEIGHCIGLAHVNAATESGLAGENRNYSKATDGANNIFDLSSGSDGVIGSRDDVRGDDENLHWFRIVDNNPFLISPTVDGSNYSRDLANLPAGHLFAENADRTVGGTLRGFPNTEAVMQQGTFSDEEQRTLMADGVSTRRLANAGLDRVAGTSDDYTLELVNLGVRDESDPACDITVEFSNETTLAFCSAGGTFLPGDNIVVNSARSVFSPQVSWFFNDVSNADGILDVSKSASSDSVEPGGELTYSITVDAMGSDQTGVMLTDNLPAGTALVSDSINCGGSESGGTITFPIGNLTAGQSAVCGFSVNVTAEGGSVSFSDDMESGAANWIATQTSGGVSWILGNAGPRSGSNAWFGEDTDSVTDFALQFASPINIPSGAELIFWHDFNLESTFDGGVLEISTNGGTSWTDLGSQIIQGGYNSSINGGFSNPIGGRAAWSGDLNGYQEVTVDLSAFAGQDVLVRWRLGTDSSEAAEGWYVDDVSIENRVTIDNMACAVSNENIALTCDSTSTIVALADRDNDGLPDDYETANGLDPEDNGSANIDNGPDGDPDGDGLTNLEEFIAGTFANQPDSDGDGLGDAIDQDPLANDSNACVEDGLGDAQFDVTAMSGLLTQCAASNSVSVRTTAIFELGSITQIISPNIRLDSDLGMPLGAELRLQAIDPTPGAQP